MASWSGGQGVTEELASAIHRCQPVAVGAAWRICRTPRTGYLLRAHIWPAGDFHSIHRPSSGRNCGSVAGVGVAFQTGVLHLVANLLLIIFLVVIGGCRRNLRRQGGGAG